MFSLPLLQPVLTIDWFFLLNSGTYAEVAAFCCEISQAGEVPFLLSARSGALLPMPAFHLHLGTRQENAREPMNIFII